MLEIQLSWLLPWRSDPEMSVVCSRSPESSEMLYSLFCLYIWGQLPVKLIIIKQFILFYAAHTITHISVISIFLFSLVLSSAMASLEGLVGQSLSWSRS